MHGETVKNHHQSKAWFRFSQREVS